MTNRSNCFKCCSNLFVSILLLNIVVIITAAYIFVVYHLNREAGNISVQPAPVVRGLKKWTTKTRGYFEAGNISVQPAPVARGLTKWTTKTRGYSEPGKISVQPAPVARGLTKWTTKTHSYSEPGKISVQPAPVARGLTKWTTKTHGYSEPGKISIQPAPVARGLTKWTTKTRDYFKAGTISVEPAPVTRGLTSLPTKTGGHFARKKKVIIFVGIMSAPRLISRRNALRKSWLTQCIGIPCLFFSDSQDMYGNKLPDNIYMPLQQEQLLHKDLILAQSPGGINFALRYLWILNWANARYQFEYFLRMDDDYFVCMDRLLLELPHRSREKLYWGYVHCSPPGGVRVDEGFVIVSNDLAQTFLRQQNKTLMCHAYGDQAMIMWINNIPGVTYFGDPRVHHAVVNRDKILQYEDICENFLALHGSYPAKVDSFWKHYLSKRTKKKYTIPPVTYPCGTMSKTFNYRSFGGMYHAEPRPCRENPIWNIGEFYGGRGG